MRQLMILRHAKAVPGGPHLADRERPLDPRGSADATRMGAFLNRHDALPHRALVSPALRTRETWAALTKEWTTPPPVAFETAIYNADPADLLPLLQDQRADELSLMIVGHNPGLHELALLLTASGDPRDRENLAREFPTTALAVIEFASERWGDVHTHGGRLCRFVTPKMIATPVE